MLIHPRTVKGVKKYLKAPLKHSGAQSSFPGISLSNVQTTSAWPGASLSKVAGDLEDGSKEQVENVQG